LGKLEHAVNIQEPAASHLVAIQGELLQKLCTLLFLKQTEIALTRTIDKVLRIPEVGMEIAPEVWPHRAGFGRLASSNSLGGWHGLQRNVLDGLRLD
jgi:hypothetical protein